MSQYQSWLERSQALYDKQVSSLRDPRLVKFLPEPIGFKRGNNKSLVVPSRNTRNYWNICAFEENLFDGEFGKDKSSALLINESGSEKRDQWPQRLYFTPSVNMTPLKKSLLLEENTFQLDLGIDPYSLGLWESKLYKSWIDVEQFNFSDKHKLFRLSTQAYDSSGADPSQQLALLLASLVQVIDDYEAHLKPSEVMGLVSFEVTLSANLMLSVAKLQAFRLLVDKVMTIFGGADHVVPPVFGVASLRRLASREHWNNILRLTSINASAIMGGADGVVNLPYDLFCGMNQNRNSRNIELILQQEAFLDKVQDPTLGSFSLDSLVGRICEESWEFFQEIDEKGGLKAALRSGWIQDEIDREQEAEILQFRQRKIKMTGVNEFVLTTSLSEEDPLPDQDQVLDLERWWSRYICHSQAEKLCDVQRLIPIQLSRIFEDWQFNADRLRKGGSNDLQLGVFVEKELRSSPKLTKLKALVSLAGLEMVILSEGDSTRKINLVMAGEPEGDFSKQVLSRVRESSDQICLWVGEKSFAQYDGHVGETSDHERLFKMLFSKLGVE